MFQQLLETIALSLDKRSIPYMVIGGQAVLLYGEPRLTRDIDVTLGIGPDRFAEILELAGQQGWRILPESPAEFVPKTLVLPCLDPESGIRVDFIFSFSDYERQAMTRVRRVTIGKASVRFAALEDLIIHKVVAGRALDLDDVRKILLKKPSLDLSYLHLWLSRFEPTLGEPILQRFDQLYQDTRPE